jgi:hypothetical protein
METLSLGGAKLFVGARFPALDLPFPASPVKTFIGFFKQVFEK